MYSAKQNVFVCLKTFPLSSCRVCRVYSFLVYTDQSRTSQHLHADMTEDLLKMIPQLSMQIISGFLPVWMFMEF